MASYNDNQVIRRWFWAWQNDKEEKFLDNMSEYGRRLTQVSLGKYVFTKDDSGKVKYQIDFKGSTKTTETEYIQFYEDSDWHVIGKPGPWYYFAREYDDENEPDISIFNNNNSRMRKYRRIFLYLLISGFPVYFYTIFILSTVDKQNFYFPNPYFPFRISFLYLQ